MRLGFTPLSLRADFLQKLLPQVEWVRGSLSELILDSSLQGFFVHPDESREVIAKSKNISRHLQQHQFCDFVEMGPKGAWPRCFLWENGLELVSENVKYLNNKKKAYIAGEGSSLRIWIELVTRLGFRQICLIQQEEASAQQTALDMARICFSVEFQIVNWERISLLPNDGSLLISLAKPSERGDLVNSLAFLNYLSLEGLVIEAHSEIGENILANEALHSQIHFIPSRRTWSFVELKALQALGLLLDLTFQQYEKQLNEFSIPAKPPLV